MAKRYFNENNHHISQWNPHYVFLCMGVICWCVTNWNNWDRISISIHFYFPVLYCISIYSYIFVPVFTLLWLWIRSIGMTRILRKTNFLHFSRGELFSTIFCHCLPIWSLSALYIMVKRERPCTTPCLFKAHLPTAHLHGLIRTSTRIPISLPWLSCFILMVRCLIT